MPERLRGSQILALAAIYLIWGSTYLAIRYAIDTLPPLLMAGTRFLVAGSLLFLWPFRGFLLGRGTRRTTLPSWSEWRSAAVIGGLLLLCGNGGVVWAEQFVPSGFAALLVATEPLWIVLLLLAGGSAERPGGRAVTGLLAGFAGVALLLWPDVGGAAKPMALAGSLVIIAAALAWAAGSLYARRAAIPLTPVLGTAMQMLTGGALLVLAGLARGEAREVDLVSVTRASWLAWGYLVVFGSLIAFSAYIFLLRTTPPALVATYGYVNPIVAVLLGHLLRQEPLDGRTLLAALAIIAAVLLAGSGRRSGGRLPPARRELPDRG